MVGSVMHRIGRCAPVLRGLTMAATKKKPAATAKKKGAKKK